MCGVGVGVGVGVSTWPLCKFKVGQCSVLFVVQEITGGWRQQFRLVIDFPITNRVVVKPSTDPTVVLHSLQLFIKDRQGV